MLTRSSRLSVRKLRLYKHRSWRAGAAPRSLAGRADERRQLVALFTPYAKITFGKKMLGGALPPRRPVTAWPKERYLAATPWPLAHQASLSAEPYHAVVTCALRLVGRLHGARARARRAHQTELSHTLGTGPPLVGRASACVAAAGLVCGVDVLHPE